MFGNSLLSDPLILFHGASISQHDSILREGLVGKPLLPRDAIIEFEEIKKKVCGFELTPRNQDWLYSLSGTLKISWTLNDYNINRPPVFLSFVPTIAYCTHVGGELASGAYDMLLALKSVIEDPESVEQERIETYNRLRRDWIARGFQANQIRPYEPVDLESVKIFLDKYSPFINKFEVLKKAHTKGVIYAVRLTEPALISASIQDHCISVAPIPSEQIIQFQFVDLGSDFDFTQHYPLRFMKKKKLKVIRDELLKRTESFGNKATGITP